MRIEDLKEGMKLKKQNLNSPMRWKLTPEKAAKWWSQNRIQK